MFVDPEWTLTTLSALLKFLMDINGGLGALWGPVKPGFALVHPAHKQKPYKISDEFSLAQQILQIQPSGWLGSWREIPKQPHQHSPVLGGEAVAAPGSLEVSKASLDRAWSNLG
ncbi:hypothetical protein HGM15179_003661 [Zosterops borbonicus]|uniref:Uncharacterized protein n=1 Tax=Zosterops borbonicus TaxID=364589 RepID=A0A8K1LRQ5_9PASS|nr:hypothetical protein HGM15179_003661 [Zosterops borbonicus]